MTCRSPALLALLLVGLIGCAKGPKRHDISGKVTYDGKPVFYGTIYFEPTAGNTGPQGAGEIHEGAYRTNRDYGSVPGPHVVRITGWTGSPAGAPPAFANYETRVDLPDEEKKDLDFDVPLMKGKPGGKK